MSTTNAPAYCETEDVQEALQEASQSMGQGPLQDANVEAAIIGASRWLRTQANAHWYDSNAAASDLISSSAASTTNRQLDVPSTPHRPRGQLFRSGDDRLGTHRYPNTQAGPYCRVRLPVHFVESVDVLEVRDRAGEVTDWVAASEFTEGRGEDYYVTTEGGARGRSHLWIHAASLAPMTHYDAALTVDLSYGKDWDSQPWDDVRRGVAALAAAQLVVEDNVLAQVPDSGQLINVDTQAQHLLNQAFGHGRSDDAQGGMGGYLSPYLSAPVV